MRISISPAMEVLITSSTGNATMFTASVLDDPKRLLADAGGPLATERVRNMLAQVESTCSESAQMTVLALLAKVALDAYRATLPRDSLESALGRRIS